MKMAQSCSCKSCSGAQDGSLWGCGFLRMPTARYPLLSACYLLPTSGCYLTSSSCLAAAVGTLHQHTLHPRNNSPPISVPIIKQHRGLSVFLCCCFPLCCCCVQMLRCTNTSVKSPSLCRTHSDSVIFNTAPNLQPSACCWSSKTITNYQPHLFCCIVCFVITGGGWWWLLGLLSGSGGCVSVSRMVNASDMALSAWSPWEDCWHNCLDVSGSWNDRITNWFGLEGTLNLISFHPVAMGRDTFH